MKSEISTTFYRDVFPLVLIMMLLISLYFNLSLMDTKPTFIPQKAFEGGALNRKSNLQSQSPLVKVLGSSKTKIYSWLRDNGFDAQMHEPVNISGIRYLNFGEEYNKAVGNIRGNNLHDYRETISISSGHVEMMIDLVERNLDYGLFFESDCEIGLQHSSTETAKILHHLPKMIPNWDVILFGHCMARYQGRGSKAYTNYSIDGVQRFEVWKLDSGAMFCLHGYAVSRTGALKYLRRDVRVRLIDAVMLSMAHEQYLDIFYVKPLIFMQPWQRPNYEGFHRGANITNPNFFNLNDNFCGIGQISKYDNCECSSDLDLPVEPKITESEDKCSEYCRRTLDCKFWSRNLHTKLCVLKIDCLCTKKKTAENWKLAVNSGLATDCMSYEHLYNPNPGEPVFRGCFVNDHADEETGFSYLKGQSFESCFAKSKSRGNSHFGLEHPSGVLGAKKSFCVFMKALPSLREVEVTKCVGDISKNGMLLGDNKRVAVYSFTKF